jgi:exodeoxyribonuclease VII large subunit
VIVDVDPSFTIGQLELHRQATINRLLTECSSHIQRVGDGFKTRNNSVGHATVIQRIAVISSSSSAGYGDFMDALYRNKYGYRFQVNNYFTSVQGEANADAAAKQIEEICASGIKFDTVVIIRGGGADTDFLIFDQYNLCSAVAKLHIPVITGIGHLKNQSIVDMLAHTPTNAPTKAAEFIVAHNLAFETLLLNEQKRVVIKSQHLLGRHNGAMQAINQSIARKARAVLTNRKEQGEKLKQRIATSSKAILFRQKLLLSEMANKSISKPLLCLASKRSELQGTQEGLKRSVQSFYLKELRGIEKYETMCRLMSPVNLLKKGFAMVYHNGKIITEGKGLQRGDEITVRLQDTEIKTTITDKIDYNGDSLNL